MKAKILLPGIILTLVVTTGFSQDKTRGGSKEERRLEKQNQTEELINSGSFVFTAITAIPSGMATVNLTTNHNYIKFQPGLVESFMPFFGRAYSGIGYNTDTGMKFRGVPEKFTMEKKRKTYYINATVKGEYDIYSLFLSIGLDGSASLSIASNNRSTISYQGNISAIENTENK